MSLMSLLSKILNRSLYVPYVLLSKNSIRSLMSLMFLLSKNLILSPYVPYVLFI